MAKDNLHELYKKYMDMKSGKPQNMADGGKAESEDSVINNLADAFAKAFKKPEPAPTPDPTLQDKYDKIRQQNRQNFDHSGMANGGKVGSGSRFATLEKSLSHQKSVDDPGALAASIGRKKYGDAKMNSMAHAHMASGGQVSKKLHDHSNLMELKAAFDKFVNEESKEKMSQGGFVPEGDIKHYDDGGYVEASDAPAKEMDKRQQVADVFKSHPSKPAEVQASNDSGDQGSIRDFLGFADGGEVEQDPVMPDLSPEEIAAREQELEQLKSKGAAQVPVQGEEQNIMGSLPAKESDLEESTNADDKSLEEKLANEDFNADEKSDENPEADKELASDEEESDDEDDFSDENKSVPELKSPAQVEAPAPSTSASAAVPPMSSQPDMAAGLQVNPQMQQAVNKMKPSQFSANALKDAQNQRDSQVMAANMGKFGNLIGAGIAGSRGQHVTPVDPSYYDDLVKQAGLPVQKYEEQVANQSNDPNSLMSNVTKDYFKSKGIKVPQNASYNDLSKIAPMIKSDQIFQAGLQKVMMQQTGAANRNATSNQTKSEIAKQKNALGEKSLAVRQEMAKLAKSNKATNDQNKALTQTQTLLESARGNPAAAQAEKDLYSAQKANSLINMYGDPNKLSPQQVSLLVSEVAKIATGGVPTGHEQEALQPGTGASKLAALWSKLSNQPSPANAGAFIKQFKDYNDALSKDAQKVVQDKYGRVIETRKKQLGDDNYKSLQDQYLNRFKPAEEVPVDADLSKMSPAELKNYIKLHGG